MTTIPRPGDPTGSFAATYDAFHRLVKLVDGADTVAEYEYDASNRRIVKSIYSSGTLDHRQHVYYSAGWQVLEVRKEVGGSEDADPLEQYVWHAGFVDALLLRDYDADTNGTAVRYYYAQDTNYNVTAVLDASGAVLERYHYTAFGTVTVLDADFSGDADGLSDLGNEVTFPGRRLDGETGLFYFRNRMYHAQLGLFIGRDPAGYVDGMSLYGGYFVPGGMDPFGLQDPRNRLMPGGGGGGGGGGGFRFGSRGYGRFRTRWGQRTPYRGGGVPRFGGPTSPGGRAVSPIGTSRLPSTCRPKQPTNMGPRPSKAPNAVQPGVRKLEGYHVDKFGRTQPWRAHYDKYGRITGRTDYNAGNKAAGIPDVHYHRWEYNSKFPLGRKIGNHIPGEFPK